MVRVADAAVVPVPRLALPHPALFAGALPMAALPAEAVVRAGTPAQPLPLFDVQALKAHADATGLAANNTPVAAEPGGTAGTRQPQASAQANQGPRRHMITCALASDTATPIAQVAEIVPFAAAAKLPAGAGAMLAAAAARSAEHAGGGVSRRAWRRPRPPD